MEIQRYSGSGGPIGLGQVTWIAAARQDGAGRPDRGGTDVRHSFAAP